MLCSLNMDEYLHQLYLISVKNFTLMENQTKFIAEESAARLRATIGELDQLIQVEKDKTRLTELQQLRNKIKSLLEQLKMAH